MKQASSEAAATPRSTSSFTLAALARIERLLRSGTLVIELPDGDLLRYVGTESPQPEAHLRLHNFKPLWALATRGSIGFAESYLAGDWDSDSLRDFMVFAAGNDDADAETNIGVTLVRLAAKLQHRLRANSRRQARRNIAQHYDLGNDFYGHWLDQSMTYSAALFEHPDEPLAAAQTRKYKRLADTAGIANGDRVLEIGCGWGGFMEYAARAYDVEVLGVSISREQCRYAEERIARAGLANRCSVEFSDYRDLEGCFDRIVSIEMFEAVGEAYWDIYAAQLQRLLKPGGVAALQVITIDESRFEHYRKTPDFIQKYIFPGGMLPSKTSLEQTFTRAGLTVTDRFDFGLDYAQTIVHWRNAFDLSWPAIRDLGFDTRFQRLWHFYLAYCEGAFRQGAIDVVQIRLEHAA
ncbi:MAG: cyclopropane-fatty-acyl-phospholipid synthase [Gammaproteobacteria bacterium]|jgi:cyclopropane-fatty-acyl-phospholipid synthase